MKLQWNLKTRLVATFLGVGVTPLVLSNYISFSRSSAEVKAQAEARVTAVVDNKTGAIESYFKGEAEALRDLADVPTTIEGLKDFSQAMSRYSAHALGREGNAKAQEFFDRDFARLYKEKNPQAAFDSGVILSKLDPIALSAQHDFIVANPHPLGEKLKLDTPARSTPYARLHADYHEKFRAYVERHALYDLFLVDNQGRVVYTVFKETDFATSLESGPYAQSGLGAAFRATRSLPSGKLHLEDFAPYLASYEAPASFLSTPLFDKGRYVGALIVQLPLDRISALVNNREGLGDKGQTLLLGTDGKLRADAFREKEKYNVAASFAPGSTIKIDMQGFRESLQGEAGNHVENSYDGTEVLLAHRPLEILGVKWVILTELPTSEVFVGLAGMQKLLWTILSLSLLAIGLVAWWTGGRIAGTLQAIIDRLAVSSKELSAAAASSASSATELSEAATEQAASLQETMASIEEISAMVSQNAESATKAKGAVEQNQSASQDGTRSVEQMLVAIQEIKATNGDILQQMETGNREFAAIVKIISEIGEKTKVINDIVFQTKLLSFNASVEAARAGEHGKGFAVVAEEVGNLAQMSGNAAKEITEMLSRSITRVNEIVEQTTRKVDQLVEVGKDKVSMGQSTAQQCKEALQRITQNAQAVASMVTEIAHASKEQAQGVQEINKAISQLDQVTQQNSGVAQLSSTQAEQLNSESQMLTQAVETLVGFVSGASGVGGAGSETSEMRRTAQPKAKVVDLGSRRKGPEAAVKAPRAKRVANGDTVPSSSDPNFEEF